MQRPVGDSHVQIVYNKQQQQHQQTYLNMMFEKHFYITLYLQDFAPDYY